jgi:hypothetical protein
LIGLIEDFFDLLFGDFFGVDEVFEKILDAFNSKLKVDGLDELAFAFFICDSFEDKHTDLIDEVFGYDSSGFLDMVHEQLDALVSLVFLKACRMVEERVSDGSLVDFLRVKIRSLRWTCAASMCL